MHLNGTYAFKAPVDQVWDMLMNTETIAGCLPGCRELQPLGDDRYKAELVIAVAAITGNYSAEVSIEDKTRPQSYRLLVRGSGRPGFVNGNARVTLEPSDAGTTVHVEADADVGGAVARLGQRLIEGVARTTMNRFFACLSARVDA